VSPPRFEAMGCEIVVGGATRAELQEIERLFRDRERVFSRFEPESELNWVNRASGRFVGVSKLFADTLATALCVAEETEGIVDPTLGAALLAAGYTRDFARLADDVRPTGTPTRGAWRSVSLIHRHVRVPAGVRLDLNGVVKALAVDDALGFLSGEGFVSAGGDLAVRGEFNVLLPDGETVLLRRGGLATSGSTKRRWLRAGEVQHHLIDASCGRPSDSSWEQVTACGANCLAADVAAKAGFLLGKRGPGWLDLRGIPARFLMAAGEVRLNAVWQRSMEEAATCI